MAKVKVPVLSVEDGKGNAIPIPAIRGESAYQIAVRNGFKGTEQEWLDSLKADVIIKSSTPGSSKQFKLTVDDSGTLKATEVV